MTYWAEYAIIGALTLNGRDHVQRPTLSSSAPGMGAIRRQQPQWSRPAGGTLCLPREET
jgi:hypothetical protein